MLLECYTDWNLGRVVASIRAFDGLVRSPVSEYILDWMLEVTISGVSKISSDQLKLSVSNHD